MKSGFRDYVVGNIKYYTKGYGIGEKKYSNIVKILFWSVVEWIQFRMDK